MHRKRAKKYHNKVRTLWHKNLGKIACFVLAAGISSRFGPPKQLVKLGPKGKTLIQNAVDVANGSKRVDYVFVVLGYNSSEIMEKLKIGNAQILLNKDFKKGLSTSIRTAIANVPDDCTAAVFMVADQPLLKSRHIDLLIDSFSKRADKTQIAALSYEDDPRNPAIFAREMFSKLIKIKGDNGARKIVKANESESLLVNVKDPRVFLDIDTSLNLRDLSC